MNIDNIQEKIKNHRDRLLEHKLYSNIETIKDLQLFTENHIYAVWDFMSLLKSVTRIEKINLIFDQIDIDQLKKISFTFKPSNLTSILNNKINFNILL